MEKMIDLRDLLKHEIVDLYSVESQIIDALPAMIEKAGNPSLKKALSEHLAVTEKQKERLDQIKGILVDQSTDENKEAPGFFTRIFGAGEEKCKGMEGILDEGKKMMGADMSPEVLDAAIIASSQKVEHYEICGYGTALAYARELRLQEVADLLSTSLDEEYEADDNLTFLAVGHLNLEAEFAGGDLGDDQPLKEQGNKRNNASRNQRSSKSSSGKPRSGSQRATVPQKSAASKKAAPKKSAPKKAVTGSGRGGSSKSAPGKGMNGKKGNTAPKKSASASKSSAGKSSRSSATNKSAGRASGKAMTAGNRGGKTSSKNAGTPSKGNSRSSAPKKSGNSNRSMMSKAPAKKGNSKSNSKGNRR